MRHARAPPTPGQGGAELSSGAAHADAYDDCTRRISWPTKISRASRPQTIHAGQVPDPTTPFAGSAHRTGRAPSSSRAPSTPPTSSASRNSAISTRRLGNPTNAVLEDRDDRPRGRRGLGDRGLGHGGHLQYDRHDRPSRRRDRLGLQPLRRHLHALRRDPPRPRHHHQVRRRPRPEELREGHHRQDPPPLRRDASAIPSSTSRTSPPSPRSPRSTISPSSSTPPSRRPTSSSRSSSAPTSSSTPSPSGWAAMAPR